MCQKVCCTWRVVARWKRDARAELLFCSLSHLLFWRLLEASKHALLGKISYKCFLLINPSILLNNLMLVNVKNLGKTVRRLILFFVVVVLPVCLALYLDSCQRLLKLTSQMRQSVKKSKKSQNSFLGIHVIIYRLLSNIYDHLRKLVKRAR